MHTIMEERIRQTYENKNTQAQINVITQLLENLDQQTHLSIAEKKNENINYINSWNIPNLHLKEK